MKSSHAGVGLRVRPEPHRGAAFVEPSRIRHLMQHEPRVRGVLVLGTVELGLTTVHPDPVREVCQVARARVAAPHRVAKQHERLFLEVIRRVLDKQPRRVGTVLPDR